MNSVCCSTPPVTSNYTPQGQIHTLGDLPVYSVGPNDASLVIVCVYDIFGFHNNTKQFSDLVAKGTGARVITPDFFRGQPWTAEKMAGGREPLLAWIGAVGTWEKISVDINAVVEDERKKGAQKFGVYGFCWGAKIAVQATKDGATFIGAGLIHPSFVTEEDAKVAQAPILALPTKDDPDMTAFMAALKEANPAAHAKSVHHRFEDVFHGWAAARGDWSVELQAQRANEAIKLVSDFFKSLAPQSKI